MLIVLRNSILADLNPMVGVSNHQNFHLYGIQWHPTLRSFKISSLPNQHQKARALFVTVMINAHNYNNNMASV